MGFVYLNGIWGGHAWTEMLIDGNWIQMDAAVDNGPGAADAARFYFAESTLDVAPATAWPRPNSSSGRSPSRSWSTG